MCFYLQPDEAGGEQTDNLPTINEGVHGTVNREAMLDVDHSSKAEMVPHTDNETSARRMSRSDEQTVGEGVAEESTLPLQPSPLIVSLSYLHN